MVETVHCYHRRVNSFVRSNATLTQNVDGFLHTFGGEALELCRTSDFAAMHFIRCPSKHHLCVYPILIDVLAERAISGEPVFTGYDQMHGWRWQRAGVPYGTVGVEKLPIHYLLRNGDHGSAFLWKSKGSDHSDVPTESLICQLLIPKINVQKTYVYSF